MHEQVNGSRTLWLMLHGYAIAGGVAPRVPQIGSVAEKWAKRAQGAQVEYTAGVTGAGGRWLAGSTAAGATYRTAVTAAAGAGRYEKGLQKAGGAKYERGATEKGPSRYAGGVAVAQPDYQTAFGPFLSAIGSVDLPPRGPRGSEQNNARIAPITRALAALRTR